MKTDKSKIETPQEQLDIPVVSTSYSIKDDVCESCGGFLDEHSENGYCFNCVMDSCTPGNHY